MMKLRIAEVSYDDKIIEYEVVAADNVQARGLIIRELPPEPNWKSIRIRDTLSQDPGPARVLGKRSG